ncbi:MAG TPA: DinB family protein [Vicinamibacterales bacterium]|nr:DinB family protein [Vicinamibacterales bacterium]
MKAFAPVVVFTLLASVATAGPMTAGERQRLVAHLDMTESWLEDEVKNLSDAQRRFKMTPESWSVEEVVMHLAIAEPQYWDQFNQSLAKPVQPDFKPQATDAAMLWYGIDRTQRTTTGEARVPRDQFKDLASAHASFKKLRAEMMKVAKETQEDLRGRQFLTASQDLYQWFLMISTHSQRHIMQIREVKAHRDFPKK